MFNGSFLPFTIKLDHRVWATLTVGSFLDCIAELSCGSQSVRKARVSKVGAVLVYNGSRV